MNDLHKVHDLFFKVMFSYYTVHRGFTEWWLRSWVNDFKLVVDSMQLVQAEMVNKIFGSSFSDLIFEIKSLLSEEAVYLLLEHKSSVDFNIREQLDKYIGNAKSLYHSSHPQRGLAVSIKPVVIYHGQAEWNVPLTLELSCFTHGTQHICTPIEYKLIDLARIRDNQIIGPPILRIIFLTLKYIRHEQFPAKLDSILVLFKELEGDPFLRDYVNIFTHYVDHAAQKDLRMPLVKKIRAFFENGGNSMDENIFKGKSRLMQILEKDAIKMGMEKGLKEGKENGLREGLKEGMKEGREVGREEGIDIGADMGAIAAFLLLSTKKSDEEIAEKTALSVEKVRQLRKKICSD